MLEISTLGNVAIRLNGKEVSGLPSRKAEALLVYLAVTHQVQRRDFLAALLWEEEQSRALGNLRVVLTSLRSQIGSYLDIQHDRVGILPGAEIHVDVLKLGGSAPVQTDTAFFSQIKSALDLYQGSFLQGFTVRNAPLFENWATIEREHFQTVFDNKFEILLDYLVTRNDWQQVIEWGENWVARSRGYVPESAFRALMIGYAGMGNLPGLSSIYQRCIQHMHQDLGVDPSEQTQQLYAQLLDGKKPKLISESAPTPISTTSEVNPAQVVLNRWRSSQSEFIDMAGLSLIYADLKNLTLGRKEIKLIIGSAIHHGLDIRPWVKQIGAPSEMVAVLNEQLSLNPQPYIHIQIIDALKDIPGEPSRRVLHDLSFQDNSSEGRVEAAMAALARGEGEMLAHQLADRLQEKEDTSTLAPLVALVDGLGEAPQLGFYPSLMLLLGVMKRRRDRYRDAARSMTWRSMIAAVIISIIHGSMAPIYGILFYRDDYPAILTSSYIIAWALSGAVGYLLIGGAQGLASGMMIGQADALAAPPVRRKWRFLAAAISGLLYAVIVTIFAAGEMAGMNVNAVVYIPTLIIYGLVFGGLLSFIYPELGILRARRQQLLRALWVSAGLAAATTLHVYILYGKETLEALPHYIAFAILFTFGIALAFSKKEKTKTN